MCHWFFLGSRGDVGDLHFREVLAMPVLPLVALAAPKLEDDELFASTVADDLGRDLGTLDEGLPKRGRVTEQCEHLVEHDILARITRDTGKTQHVPCGYAVLLAATTNDCAGHWVVGP